MTTTTTKQSVCTEGHRLEVSLRESVLLDEWSRSERNEGYSDLLVLLTDSIFICSEQTPPLIGTPLQVRHRVGTLSQPYIRPRLSCRTKSGTESWIKHK